MTLSIWRYSHLLLAIASSVFLLIASVTGVILAVEPVTDKIGGYNVESADTLSIAEVIVNVKAQHEEIIDISRDANGFVSANVVSNGKNESFYINPHTGEKLAEIPEKSPIFQFATNLHRSLFLKSTGRFFVGLVSFLLFLIAVSGVILIAKRQGGISRFFSTIVRENFSQFYHIVISRVVLIPIIIISLSGVYLSLLRFSIIPEPVISHTIDYDNISETPQIETAHFPVFQQYSLSELKNLEFPFSEFPEDPFYLDLDSKELVINQYTGQILSEQEYPFVVLSNKVATFLHTGKGSILWSIVLGLATLSIPFLIVFGFVISLKRPKTKFKNSFSKDKSDFIILVGTEGGTTFQFAKELHNALIKAGKSSFIAEMNHYSSYKTMEHLIVLTSTYGQGEAPNNAAKFEEKFKKIQQKKPFSFAVVGFGSTAYPHFCQFAFDIEKVIEAEEKSIKLLNIHTVNNQSFTAFEHWTGLWSRKAGVKLDLQKPVSLSSSKKTTNFEVISKDDSNITIDETFLLQLKIFKNKKFKSGDLLAVNPGENSSERLYSIGKLKKKSMLISIKRHEKGLCSNFLYQLEPGQKLKASLIENKGFHFPKKGKKVIMIATGTGIGPFLGMVSNNNRKRQIHLYWGAKTASSLQLYNKILTDALENNKLSSFKPAYSQTDKEYVQHLLQKDELLIAETLKTKGCIMICGSIAMQKEVLELLKKICEERLDKDLGFFQNKKQIKMDCY